ncbi:MAG: hypothetical protein J1E81_09580 [Eubacterium sp.]|nr:hypothetical protein [Eubacterium sp.]
MSKIKSAFSLFLAVVIVLLSGCSDIQSLVHKNNSDFNSDFYEIADISSKANNYSSIDINGDNILFLTSENEKPYELTLYDANNDRVIAETSLSDCPFEYISGAKFNSENEIIIFDESSEKGITYDLSLNKTGETEYSPKVSYDSAEKSELITDRFTYEDTYASSREGDNFYFVSYSNVEEVYVFNDFDKDFLDVNDKKLLLSETEYSEKSRTSTITVSVEDYENALCLNKITLDKTLKGYYSQITVSSVSDKYACFVECISNEITGGQKFIPFLWKYTENSVNEKTDVKKMTKNDFNTENSRLIDEIKGKYGIDVKVNEEAQFTDHNADYDATPLEVNFVLFTLNDALSLFPENFIKEVYDLEYINGLTIYIVSSIEGAGAYAVDFIDPLEIVFSSSSFSESIVFHEFMHLIDNRIENYYEEHNMSFRDMWCELNPKDFEYYGDNDYEHDGEYFVSHYAMTNVEEDLADTFQTMYSVYETDYADDIIEHEHTKKKADLLCEAIRKAFPSMKNTQDVCWEKYANIEK